MIREKNTMMAGFQEMCLEVLYNLACFAERHRKQIVKTTAYLMVMIPFLGILGFLLAFMTRLSGMPVWLYPVAILIWSPIVELSEHKGSGLRGKMKSILPAWKKV